MTAIEVGSTPTSLILPAPARPVTPPRDREAARRGTVSDSPLALAAAARQRTPALQRRRRWERSYRRRLITTDTATVAVAVTTATFVQLAGGAAPAFGVDPWMSAVLPVIVALTWLLMLGAFQTRSPRVIGVGSAEYTQIAQATGLAFGLLAIVSTVFHWRGLADHLVVALPAGLIVLLMSRRWWRRWLAGQRRAQNYVARTIVVGRRRDVEHVITTLRRDDRHGYHVVGTALDESSDEVELMVQSATYPVVGTSATVAEAAREIGADTIIVASQVEDPDYTRRLSWQLEGTAADLVLSSRLTDVAGPRISLRQVEGLPLVQVRIPSFEGTQHAYKRALDVLIAGAALLPIALLAPIVVLLIKLDSPGRAIFRQRRVGLNGREFDILKFRTMRASAEDELSTLVAQSEGAGPLFKMHADPRVTRVSAVLRRFSLDELPQFWNVLRGEMSVVGPRPPLPSEVRSYDGTVSRRLYLKPGITGLWQVSGRSDLSWDESVRLDLHYVENWSAMTDVAIMCRTARVMVRPKGAY